MGRLGRNVVDGRVKHDHDGVLDGFWPGVTRLWSGCETIGAAIGVGLGEGYQSLDCEAAGLAQAAELQAEEEAR